MKKKLGRILTLWLCCMGLFAIAACGGTTSSEEVQIKLNQTAIELVVGETKKLEATVTPADAKDKAIEWKSKDEGIAVVEGGVVTAKAAGTTTVTATTNGKTASCEVTVKAASEDTRMLPDGKENGKEQKSDSKQSAMEPDSDMQKQDAQKHK